MKRWHCPYCGWRTEACAKPDAEEKLRMANPKCRHYVKRYVGKIISKP